ncbi:MAG: InlB B-repeat-containing protein [Bacilli bacterium]
MSEKDEKVEVNTSTEEVKVSKKEADTSKEKKKKIILAVVGVILLAIILFLLWFFNRKFEVTFDYNNGTKEEVILVKYNKVIDKKNVKTKEDLGEQFIDWYLVIGEKDGGDVLDDKPFDFKTKIKKGTELKAVYNGVVETITITFDSKGGSSVDPITINKGTELSLPTNPTYKGYKFITWETANGTPVYDKALLSESMTLYAKWEKVEEKKETPKQETPKQEEKKEESISLSIDNKYIHRRGRITTAKATANVQNSSNSKVTYSLSSTACAKIDSSTGAITVLSESEIGSNIQICEQGETVTVTGKLPSGKSATVKVNIEKDLSGRFYGSSSQYNDRYIGSSQTVYQGATSEFTIKANQDVSWSTSCENHSYYGFCTYVGKSSSTSTSFAGTLAVTFTNSDGTVTNNYSNTAVTFYTKAGQAIVLNINQEVN